MFTSASITGDNFLYGATPSPSSIPQKKSPSIYLFQGDAHYTGISLESFNCLKTVIESFSPASSINTCTHEEMDPKKWTKKSLVVFPGGTCSEWNKQLSSKKQKEIYRSFKEGDNSIFATCGGAYFCSKISHYVQPHKPPLLSERKIALFSGKCQGPAYEVGLKVVKIKWERTGEQGYVALIQGGEFIPDEQDSGNYEVLARYMESPCLEKIAVVFCKKDKGVAVLSAPHWEFNAEDLEGAKQAFPSLDVQKQQRKLNKSREFRQKCLSEIFNQLLT